MKTRKVADLYARWLAELALIAAIEAGADDPDELADRDGDLARTIMATPAEDAYAVFCKINIMKYYLTLGNEPTSYADSREVVLLASIKADLLRLPPGEAAVA